MFDILMTNTRKLLSEMTGSIRLSSLDLSNVSKQMTASTRKIQLKTPRAVAATAEQMNGNMDNVSSALEETAAIIQTIASATEMTATIRGIAIFNSSRK